MIRLSGIALIVTAINADNNNVIAIAAFSAAIAPSATGPLPQITP